MTEKQIINLIELTLKEKMEQDEDYIRYSFYEVNVKLSEQFKLSNQDIKMFLHLLKIKLKNNNYKVYLEGQKFEYNNAKITVQSNEVLIAIKIKKEDVKNGNIHRT